MLGGQVESTGRQADVGLAIWEVQCEIRTLCEARLEDRCLLMPHRFVLYYAVSDDQNLVKSFEQIQLRIFPVDP